VRSRRARRVYYTTSLEYETEIETESAASLFVARESGVLIKVCVRVAYSRRGSRQTPIFYACLFIVKSSVYMVYGGAGAGKLSESPAYVYVAYSRRGLAKGHFRCVSMFSNKIELSIGEQGN